ncbi:hypothetical protein P700755_001853 [Psychroflexus torquis ATCC 700755]|uniref:Secreted protein n=1 Tax=Psychroflexus torquis (strain ATCC 700755 / CIP 106069 / ACAM 623) TaxID=313595 RepID=K4IFU6_PSYTT|nr:DUF6607 family protein [Psychroflexus torquis]AFU68683.1 hypothetical protein P700755_001853 [Psychroflexus torquis ATCC 700755]
MKTPFYTLLALLFSISAISQTSKKQEDREAIKTMCGCFEVAFNFAETFNYSTDSLYKPSKTKMVKGLEWAQLVTDTDDKIQIQHLLQVGNPAEPMVMKHWRQDWLFENTDLYSYNAENEWKFKKFSSPEVTGQWTQKVFQVDDSPRYEGSGSWVHVDGKSYWENTTPAPLARREYTTRSDYNVLMRGNRHEITDYGWVHDQDNTKIIRETGKEDIVLAKEKGYNTYVKVDDSKCAAASQWWKDNDKKWALVRAKWDEVYGRNKDLVLEEKVDNKPLYKFLFEEESYEKEAEIDEVIESFVKK